MDTAKTSTRKPTKLAMSIGENVMTAREKEVGTILPFPDTGRNLTRP